MQFSVFSRRTACGLAEDLVEGCGGLEAGHKGTVRDGVTVVCEQIYGILNPYPRKVCREGHLGIFIEQF